MAAGKSTIGRILANTIGWAFADLDKEIELREGKKIADIFRDSGETAFRDLESALLRKAAEPEYIVISLGGGTILRPDNLIFILKSGTLIYLKSSPEKTAQRLKYKVDRPIFQTMDSQPLSNEEAIEKIRDLLAQREHLYLQADIIIETDQLSVGRSVDKLHKLLKKKIAL